MVRYFTDDLPLGVGAFVELHSLTKESFNGKKGEITKKVGDGRFSVKLPQGLYNLKPQNLRRHSRPLKFRRKALIAAAQGDLQGSLKLDPACVTAHFRYANIAHQQGSDPMESLHKVYQNLSFYEEIMNSKNVAMMLNEIASCMGEAGDSKGEVKVLELILAQDPDNILAKFSMTSHMRDIQPFQPRQTRPLYTEIVESKSEAVDPRQAADIKRRSIYLATRDIIHVTLPEAQTDPLSEITKEELEDSLTMLNKILAYPNILPEDKMVALSAQGSIHMHFFIHQKRQEDWTGFEECFRQARFVENAPALSRAMILFHQAECLDRCGNYEQDNPQKKHQYYEEALTLLEESEATASDPGTQQLYARVQTKVNDKFDVTVDPVTGEMTAVATEPGARIQPLPQGPTHHLPNRTDHGPLLFDNDDV